MARHTRDTKAILKTIGRSKLRSSLFWWMVEEHDEIIASKKGERMDWRSLCADAAQRKLTDTRGKPPTEGNARETWRQARLYVKADRAAAAAQPPRPVYPSRVDKNWKPANAPPPPQEPAPPRFAPPAVINAGSPSFGGGPAAGSDNALVPIRKNEPQEIKPYDPSKQMDRLRRIMAERSGRTWRE